MFGWLWCYSLFLWFLEFYWFFGVFLDFLSFAALLGFLYFGGFINFKVLEGFASLWGLLWFLWALSVFCVLWVFVVIRFEVSLKYNDLWYWRLLELLRLGVFWCLKVFWNFFCLGVFVDYKYFVSVCLIYGFLRVCLIWGVWGFLFKIGMFYDHVEFRGLRGIGVWWDRRIWFIWVVIKPFMIYLMYGVYWFKRNFIFMVTWKVKMFWAFWNFGSFGYFDYFRCFGDLGRFGWFWVFCRFNIWWVWTVCKLFGHLQVQNFSKV